MFVITMVKDDHIPDGEQHEWKQMIGIKGSGCNAEHMQVVGYPL